MADPSPYPDTDDTGVRPDRESATSTPRWVMPLLGIVSAIVLVLLLVVLHLTGVIGPGAH